MLNLAFGWGWILLGVLSGALLGLHFHKEKFLGGYDAWPRRMTRLGHIAFFGTGILNVLYALTTRSIGSTSPLLPAPRPPRKCPRGARPPPPPKNPHPLRPPPHPLFPRKKGGALRPRPPLPRRRHHRRHRRPPRHRRDRRSRPARRRRHRRRG